VAVDLDAVGAVVVGAGDEDFVDVEDLREGLRAAAETDFKLAVAFGGGGALDGGGLAFDVGEDGGDLGDLAAYVGL
jgi:alcohol dehydrogenase class IV